MNKTPELREKRAKAREVAKAFIAQESVAIPETMDACPGWIRRPSSNRSPIDSLLCSTATAPGNRPMKRLTVCGVSDISRTGTIACLPAARHCAIAVDRSPFFHCPPGR